MLFSVHKRPFILIDTISRWLSGGAQQLLWGMQSVIIWVVGILHEVHTLADTCMAPSMLSVATAVASMLVASMCTTYYYLALASAATACAAQQSMLSL